MRARTICLRALLGAALAAAVVSARPPTAGAGDLTELRARAQRVADRVTTLEHRLASLQGEKTRLREDLASADREIAALEVRRHQVDLAYRDALDDYVARAVEVYKSPSPSASVELILSARDINELVALSHLSSASAEAARESLAHLYAARRSIQNLQDQIDDRKQQLLARSTALQAVTAQIRVMLDDRRGAYKELGARIAKLEAEARREARREARAAATSSASPASPGGFVSDGVPPGFVTTGVSFEGIASWYGPGFEGQTTAHGDIFDPGRLTAASRDLPLGSWLYVQHEGHGVVVYVNDRGPYIEGRVLDLSQAAAEAIGISGLGWIRAEVLVKL